jgi:hypothetical protein
MEVIQMSNQIIKKILDYEGIEKIPTIKSEIQFKCGSYIEAILGKETKYYMVNGSVKEISSEHYKGIETISQVYDVFSNENKNFYGIKSNC